MATHYGPRGFADGTLSKPFGSPVQAMVMGAASGGTYHFKADTMSSAVQLEFQNNYYEGIPFCRVFTSPYNSTATLNRLDLNIPMKGLLVQRDTLDIRAAVYWTNPILYNTLSGVGNNTADSGHPYRRVLLGGAGSHGLYNTTQQSCNWGDSVGSVGAGWTGTTCGSWPNALQWGTGQSGTATYTNLSGTWSHWVFWGGVNIS
jgi:hypothetical protein